MTKIMKWVLSDYRIWMKPSLCSFFFLLFSSVTENRVTVTVSDWLYSNQLFVLLFLIEVDQMIHTLRSTLPPPNCSPHTFPPSSLTALLIPSFSPSSLTALLIPSFLSFSPYSPWPLLLLLSPYSLFPFLLLYSLSLSTSLHFFINILSSLLWEKKRHT